MALVSCSHDACDVQVETDTAHRFSFGISHYGPSGKSYLQVHESQHCCSHDHAKEAIRARIALHKGFTHGQFVPELNPTGNEYPNALVRANAEYHVHTRGKASLPTACAICAAPLTTDWYLPHVDHGSKGRCYQAILQAADPQPKSLEQYDLAACSVDHAMELGNRIIDEILDPMHHVEEAAK